MLPAARGRVSCLFSMSMCGRALCSWWRPCSASVETCHRTHSPPLCARVLCVFLSRFNFYYNIARGRVAAGLWAPGRRPRGAPRAGRRVFIAETLFSNGDRQSGHRIAAYRPASTTRRIGTTTYRRNDACLGARYPLHGRATFRTRTATAGSQNGVGSAAHRRRAQLHSSSMRTRRSSAASTRPWA
jgi:hypothetical protein